MGKTQSKEPRRSREPIIDDTHYNIPAESTMNPSDQRNLLPAPPPMYTSNDAPIPPEGGYPAPTGQNLTPMGGYPGSFQSYSHIPINPIPAPPYHKIAQPMHSQEPIVSQQYQQYPQQNFGQTTYSQSYSQQIYPQSSYQSTYNTPMQSLSQSYVQPHGPYQQPSSLTASQSHSSPQKYDMYQQPYQPDQSSQPTQPQVAQTRILPLQPQPQILATPNQGSQTTPNQPPTSIYQPPVVEPAASVQPHPQMPLPQTHASPPTQPQQSKEGPPVMPTPSLDSVPSDISEVPPASPEIKLTIKKTFDKGRPWLTSTLTRMDASDKNEGSGSEMSKDRNDDDDDDDAALHADNEEDGNSTDSGQLSPLPDTCLPNLAKPKTVAQKRENVKAGKTTVLPKLPLQSNPPPTPFDEKPCEWLVGDLVWSKVTGHPWWPCMVAYDPNLGIYTRMKGAYGKSYRMYHVQFFGEVPERGWVSGCSMRKFTGRSQYEVLVQELLAKVKRRERTKMMAKLALKPTRKSAWEVSVTECEKALPMSRHERKLKFTFKYEMPKSAVGNANAEQIDIVSLGESPKMKAKRAYKKQQDSEAAAATSMKKLTPSTSDPSGTQTPSVPTPGHKPGSDPSEGDAALTGTVLLGTKRKYRKRKSKDMEGSKPAKRKRGRKSLQFLDYCSKHTEDCALEHPNKSKTEIYSLLEDKWEVLPEEDRVKYGASPTLQTPRPTRKRKVKDDRSEEQSPDADPVVKRSKRETKPSKKLQEADLDNLGFSPKMTKSLKLKESRHSQSSSRSSPAPTQTKIADKQDAPSSKHKKKRSRKKSKLLSNGASLLSKSPIKEEMPEGVTIATEMSKDFAEMQEDEPGLIIDTDLITGAIESAGEGSENTRVLVARSGHSSGDDQASIDNASHVGSTTTSGPPRDNKGIGAAKKENVCQVCERTGELLLCEGGCCGAFHLDCIGLQVMPTGTFKCDECISGVHSCFVCKTSDKDVKRCHVPLCGKYYHEGCIKRFAQTRADSRGFMCPLHLCTSCFADNPKTTKSSRGRLMRCVRCPTSFHSGDSCIAAGSIILASNAIVCSRHFQPIKTQKHHSHISVSWCFICSIGGDLICCDSCPAAFHASCIGFTSVPEGNWFCRDCTNGKRPRYNDIVWVKLGNYRWWPAQVCNPRNVPTNIQDMNHQVGEFPVQFFGSHDFFWTHQGRVFAYYEGDKGSKENAASKGLAAVFRAALYEAAEKYKQWKGFRDQKEAKELENSSKKPRPFKFIKVNKPVGRVQMPPFDITQCQPCDCKPTMDNPCGKDSDCLNRILLIECHPLVCPAGEKCQNQRFQKRLYPASGPQKEDSRGFGLVSHVDIKKGDFVNEYVGELVDEGECRERIRQAHDTNITDFYFLTLDKDRIIDAGPKGNMSRFMNHCCQPNCETQKWTVNGDTRVGLFAICDISSNSELTFNYNLDCLGNEKKRCECGAPNCSGFIGVRPKTAAAEAQAEKHKKAVDRKKLKPRRRRKVKVITKIQHDDECFRCGEGGELVMCDYKNCPKSYCLKCLKLSKSPHGKWNCPWHHCDECGKFADQLCEQCPNSYCNEHSKEKISSSYEMLLCKDHDDEEREQLKLKGELKLELLEITRKEEAEEMDERRKKMEEKMEAKRRKKEDGELRRKRKKEDKALKRENKMKKKLKGELDKKSKIKITKGALRLGVSRGKDKNAEIVNKKINNRSKASSVKPRRKKASSTKTEVAVESNVVKTDSPEYLPFLMSDSEGELVIDEDFEEKNKKRITKGNGNTDKHMISSIPNPSNSKENK